MTTTAYIYSLQTGKFTGRMLRGDMSILDHHVCVGEAMHATSGEIDWRRNRVDLATGDLIPCQPEKPADTADTFYTWDAEADDWLPAPTASKLDRDARKLRDELLAASDWTDTASAPARLGSQTYQAWQTYRQALRDITEQQTYPQTITWPQAPA